MIIYYSYIVRLQMFWIFEQCAPGNELNNVAVVSLRHLYGFNLLLGSKNLQLITIILSIYSALKTSRTLPPFHALHYASRHCTFLCNGCASCAFNRPFAASDHVVQNRPCWRASSLLFPHWDIKTKASQASLVQVSLF